MKSNKQQLIDAVDEFAEAMKVRLLSKHKQGWGGWDHKNMKPVLAERLLSNAARGSVNKDKKSLIDTANLAMMVWRKS
jgi:hypothetical protein